jgi:hypothetical protein
MATWQFELYLLPHGISNLIESGDGYDVPGVSVQAALRAQDGLVKAFGSPWLMLGDWLVYGDENGSRVDLLFDDVGTVQVNVRLDARTTNESAISSVCALASQLQCAFFSPENRQFITPQPQAVELALRESRAAKYVSNPRAYLESLPT